MNINHIFNAQLDQWDAGQRWGTMAKLASLYCGAITLTVTCNLALDWHSPGQRFLRFAGSTAALGLAAIALRENRDYVRAEGIIKTRQAMRNRAASKLGEQDIERLLNRLGEVYHEKVSPIKWGQHLEPPKNRHFALYAPTMSGKTNTLLTLAPSLDGEVIYCTTKSSDRVPPDWIGYKFSPIASDLIPQIEQFCAEMEQRFSDRTNGNGSPYWWILDEAFGITATLKNAGHTKLEKRFKSLIISHIATGASAGARLGILTQSPNSGDFAISKAAMDNIMPIICASHICPSGSSHLAAWYQHTTGQQLTPEQVDELSSLPDGFWQLTCHRGQPILYQSAKVELELVGCRNYGEDEPIELCGENQTPPHPHDDHTDSHRLETLFTLACEDFIPDDEKLEKGVVCPSCGSTRYKPNGSKRTAKGVRKRARCEDCGKSFYVD